MSKTKTPRAPRAPKPAAAPAEALAASLAAAEVEGRGPSARADSLADLEDRAEAGEDVSAEVEALAAASGEAPAESAPVESAPADEAPAEVVGAEVAAEVAAAAPEVAADPLAEFGAPTSPAAAPAAPAPKTLSARGASVSETWKRPEVRAARSTHHEVVVAGKGKFKSVPEAFRALGLPMGKMIPFRLLVKETGAATFEKVAKDGSKTAFEFSRVG